MKFCFIIFKFLVDLTVAIFVMVVCCLFGNCDLVKTIRVVGATLSESTKLMGGKVFRVAIVHVTKLFYTRYKMHVTLPIFIIKLRNTFKNHLSIHLRLLLPNIQTELHLILERHMTHGNL